MDRLEIIAAVFSPFTADGQLALKTVSRQLGRLVDDGVDGAFVCGTTGEGSSLTMSERKDLAAQWQKQAAGRFKVMVHVGHTSLREAADLAAHAQSIGADSVAAVPPYFFKPTTADDVVDCLKEVAQAAPDIGFYYYHIPMLTNISVPASEVVVRARVIPNFVGVKFTDDDFDELDRVQHLMTEVGGKVYFGRDDLLSSALRLGVRGAVGMTYNFAGKHFRRLEDAFAKEQWGDLETLQADATELLKVALPHGLTNVLKAVSALAGVDCGGTRLPLKTITAQELQSISRNLVTKVAIERLLS
jgi:N-acetylneuraminate lyase